LALDLASRAGQVLMARLPIGWITEEIELGRTAVRAIYDLRTAAHLEAASNGTIPPTLRPERLLSGDEASFAWRIVAAPIRSTRLSTGDSNVRSARPGF
jgi:hypothetical protein